VELLNELMPPDVSAPFLHRIAWTVTETLAMPLVGTLLATVAGLVLAALPASGHIGGRYSGVARAATRTVLNALRAVPELVWVSILLIAAGRLEIVRLRTNSYCVSMVQV
jgi:phosphonate transport system permease protein